MKDSFKTISNSKIHWLQNEIYKEITLFIRKKKKVMKEKRKLRDKMALNMIIPGDTMEVTDDMELFNIKKIKKKHVSFYSVHLMILFGGNKFQQNSR